MSDKWKIKNWMTKDPDTITPTMSTRDAFNKMRASNFRHLLVVQDDMLLGIVSDRDLRRPDLSNKEDGWNELYTPSENEEVRFIMSTDVCTLNSEDTIHSAVKIFNKHPYGALPVVNSKQLPVGILSVYDVIRCFGKVWEKHEKKLKNPEK